LLWSCCGGTRICVAGWDEESPVAALCSVGVTHMRRLLSSTKSLLQAHNTTLYLLATYSTTPDLHKHNLVTNPSLTQPQQHSLERNYERLRQKPAIPGPRGPMGLPGPAGLPGRTGPMGPMVQYSQIQ
jgi:hypothetical protein